MDGILGFLVAKRWMSKAKKKKQEAKKMRYASLIIEDAEPFFGYVRDRETVLDLQ